MQRKSLAGPLLLIALGALLLARNFHPELALVQLFASHWPWILIVWGGFRLFEYFVALLLGKTPPAPLGGGAFLLAMLIVLSGSLAHWSQRPAIRLPGWAKEWMGWFRLDSDLRWQDRCLELRGPANGVFSLNPAGGSGPLPRLPCLEGRRLLPGAESSRFPNGQGRLF